MNIFYENLDMHTIYQNEEFFLGLVFIMRMRLWSRRNQLFRRQSSLGAVVNRLCFYLNEYTLPALDQELAQFRSSVL
jgi:hypothetical protein